MTAISPFIFPLGVHQVSGRDSMSQKREGGCLKTLRLATEHRAISHK